MPIFGKNSAVPRAIATRSRATEVVMCACGGSYSARTLNPWESGPRSGGVVLECSRCGARAPVVTRTLGEGEGRKATPRENRRKPVEPRICERAACGKIFTPKRASSRRRFCGVPCANWDKTPEQRGKGQAPTYVNMGRDA